VLGAQARDAAGAAAPGSGASGRSGGRGGARATVVLQTNVPPGDGVVVDWSNQLLASNSRSGGGAPGEEGRWRGGKSVLKSALQKSVRLGRGEQAVRWAAGSNAGGGE
jgi:hypothetical protein